ncbi:MAG: pyridoxal-phosphate dependent enzyme [Candidatus Bathyarchaeia archaeon]
MEELDEPPDKSHMIGGTPLLRSRSLESLVGCRRLYIKLEGSNPTGSHKDRAAVECLEEARKGGYNSLAIATCGNFGASFAYFAPLYGMRAHIYIPSSYSGGRLREIAGYGALIHLVEGTYEDAVELASREAKENDWYDANPGVEQNTIASLRGYVSIALEIYRELGYTPDVVAVPVGNGTTLSGVYHGFRMLHDDGVSGGIPRMIAVSTPHDNPIVRSFLSGRRMIEDLQPSEIKETVVNEPLVSWHSFDGQLALDALWESGGWAVPVPDQEMAHYSELIASLEGLSVLPASASALAALRKVSEREKLEDVSCVAVLTAGRPRCPWGNLEGDPLR